jgi:hypothetical protein
MTHGVGNIKIKLQLYLFYKGVKFALLQSWRKQLWSVQQNKAVNRILGHKAQKESHDSRRYTYCLRQAVCLQHMRNWHNVLVWGGGGESLTAPRYSCNDKIIINFL